MAFIPTDTGTSGYTTLRYGSTGTKVVDLQKYLTQLGYYSGALDGSFGPKTLDAVKKFQTAAGLSVDGVAGPATQGALSTTIQKLGTQPPQIVKPAQKTANAYTDTGTGGTVSQVKPTVTQQPQVPGAPLPEDVARLQGATVKPTVTTPTASQIIKPAQQSTQGYTDTGTGVTSQQVKQPTVATPGAPLPEDIARMQGANPPAIPAISTVHESDAGVVHGGSGIGFSVDPRTPEQIKRDYEFQMAGQGGAVPQDMTVNVPTRMNQQMTPPGTPLPEDLERRRAEESGQTFAGREMTTEERIRNELPSYNGYPSGRTGGGGSGGTGGGGLTVGGNEVVSTVGESGTGAVIQPIASTDFAPQTNPYWDQLMQMQFEYDPATDQNYQRMAAALESSISQSMASRGGLYSSVKDNMIQVGLSNLMLDTMNQAYEAFVDERDFLLTMARDYDDRINAEFNRQMQLMEYNLSVQKEAFDQQMTIANYNLALQREAFDQQMARANYNLSAARLAYQKQQDAIQTEKWIYEQSLKVAQAEADAAHDAEVSGVERDKTIVQVSYDYTKEMDEQWKADVYANDPEVQAWFGVGPNTTYAAGAQARNELYKTLQADAQQVAQRALDVELYDVYKSQYNMFSDMGASQTITYTDDATGATISRTTKEPTSVIK